MHPHMFSYGEIWRQNLAGVLGYAIAREGGVGREG